MDLIKSNLKGVIGSSKNGILLSNLENEYKRITNSNLNYPDYPDLVSFLKSMDDILRLSYYGNLCTVYLITTENDPQCLKKLCNLIQTTRPPKKSNKRNQNIPSNIMMKANEFDNLKISVPNDLYPNDRELNGNNNNLNRSNNAASQNSSQRNNPTGFNTSHNSRNSNNFNNYNNSFNQYDNYRNNRNNGVPSSSVVPKRSYGQPVNSNNNSVPINLSQASIGKSNSTIIEQKENLSINKSIINGDQISDQMNDRTRKSNGSAIKEIGKQLSIDNLGNKASGSEQRNGDSSVGAVEPWEVVLDWQTVADVADGSSAGILHQPVRILGIQSGHALVAACDHNTDTNTNGCYLATNPFNCAFPGDLFLWQPPIADRHRPRNSVDPTNAFPVISIERISSQLMKVRIIGQKILLQVQISDLFEMPKDLSDLNMLRNQINKRRNRITLAALAITPRFVSVWNNDILAGRYFSPDCYSDGGHIFECCDKRGNFFNVMLMIHYFSNSLSLEDRKEQRIFLEQMICEINNSLRAFVPDFRNMLEKSINRSSDTSLLLYIDPHRTCLEHRMMIGCGRVFSRNDSYTNTRYLNGSDKIDLDRIVYNFNSKTYHYFDDHNKQADVSISSPISGLFMINNDFITSRLSNATKLRFHAAILNHLPCITRLQNAIEK